MTKDLERAINATRAAMSEEEYTTLQSAHKKDLGNLTDEECQVLCDIQDNMEEYGDDHDLPEGWWLWELDLDELVMKLVK